MYLNTAPAARLRRSAPSASDAAVTSPTPAKIAIQARAVANRPKYGRSAERSTPTPTLLVPGRRPIIAATRAMTSEPNPPLRSLLPAPPARCVSLEQYPVDVKPGRVIVRRVDKQSTIRARHKYGANPTRGD